MWRISSWSSYSIRIEEPEAWPGFDFDNIKQQRAHHTPAALRRALAYCCQLSGRQRGVRRSGFRHGAQHTTWAFSFPRGGYHRLSGPSERLLSIVAITAIVVNCSHLRQLSFLPHVYDNTRNEAKKGASAEVLAAARESMPSAQDDDYDAPAARPALSA